MTSHSTTRTPEHMQSLFRTALAKGAVTLESEIELRADLASLLIREYEQVGNERNPQHLRDAIEHGEAILRRLPQTSPERPQHLSRLSYAYASEYLESGSRYAVAAAVRCGRLARKEAIAVKLPRHNSELYCEILNNLGVALSYQCDNTQRMETSIQEEKGSSRNNNNSIKSSAADDLDEAIECAREFRNLATPNSSNYLHGLHNLASRLIRRYGMSGYLADHVEAGKVLRDLQSIAAPGSAESGMARMQLAQMAVNKYKRTDALEDLSDALEQNIEAIGNLPQGHEGKQAGLNQIAALFSSRYKKTNNIGDLHNAVIWSNLTLTSLPISYSAKGRCLLTHMQFLRMFVHATDSLQDIEEPISCCNVHLMEMQREYSEKDRCRQMYGDVLGRKYILSQRLEDLADAVSYIRELCYDYNNKVKESGATPPVDSLKIQRLSTEVNKLSQAPPGQTKDAGAAKLSNQIVTVCNSHDFVNKLLSIQMEFVILIGVYAHAAEVKEAITNKEANERAEGLQRKEEADLEVRLARPQLKSTDYTLPGVGLRQLAMDPTNNKIVMDLSGLMSGILGFDVSTPKSHAEFVAVHTSLESESVEKARAKAQHPNPKLCFMCRYIKPLSPTVEYDGSGGSYEGFRWNPESRFLPFGNWHQLKLRTMCAICRLILSLIVTNQTRNTLHPRLAAIDPEIQGTALDVRVAASGEEVLSIEYGMRPIGELRIVGPRNNIQMKPHTMGLRKNHNEPLRNQQVDISLLKRWLNECESVHGETCHPSHRIYSTRARYITDVPLVLIDVVNSCLITTTSSVRYFALSYVWGTGVMSKTLRANYALRCQKGGLPDDLPNTIADAVALVRALNERFLWVDAVCIVQDDAEQKAREIGKMDIVYSKAFATIIALHGTGAAAGLPGIRPSTRPPQMVETLVVDAGSRDLDYDPKGRNANEQITITLVATPPPLHLALETSWWASRGWTFQEHLLSRRCLYFSERCAYFKCGRVDSNLSEGGINEPMRSKEDYWDKPGSVPVETSLDNPLLNIHQEYASLEPDTHRSKNFKAYSKLVRMYTIRKLTQQSDIIDAFQGTFAVLDKCFHSDIICGLPVSTLDLALMWTPVGKLPRYGHDAHVLSSAAITEGRPALNHLLPTNRGTYLQVWGPGEETTFNDKVDRRFPSWSWVGWKGGVEYRLFAEAYPNEPLPRSLVHEFAVNIDGKELRTIPGRQLQQKRIVSLSRISPTQVSPTGPIQAVEDTFPDSMKSLALSTNSVDESTAINDPSLPNILQFLAPCVPFTAFTISSTSEYISFADHIHASTRQAVRHILDRRGKRCGLWWEQTGYFYVGRGVSSAAESKMLFVGISEHDDTFHARSGPTRAEGNIDLFDEEVYPAVGKGSGLVNLLAVDLDMGHEYAERVSVARIHAKAWEDSAPELKMVRLA